MPWQAFKQSQDPPSSKSSTVEEPENADIDQMIFKSRQRRRPSYLDEFDVQVKSKIFKCVNMNSSRECFFNVGFLFSNLPKKG